MNPYDPDKVAESIHAALAMPVRTARLAGCPEVRWWAGCILVCHFAQLENVIAVPIANGF